MHYIKHIQRYNKLVMQHSVCICNGEPNVPCRRDLTGVVTLWRRRRCSCRGSASPTPAPASSPITSVYLLPVNFCVQSAYSHSIIIIIIVFVYLLL